MVSGPHPEGEPLRRRQVRLTVDAIVGAALALFERQGYAGTSIGDIALAAGVSRRTFFRHFADKEEVLFGRDDDAAEALAAAFAATAPDARPLQAALDSGLHLLHLLVDGTPELQRRQRLIDASAPLRAREAAKYQTYADVLRDLLVTRRGVDPPGAAMFALAAVTCLRTAYARWLDTGDPDLRSAVRAAVRRLTVELDAIA